MCCLFGLLDYKNVFTGKEKNIILSALSTEAESRGIDAAGIAYNANGRLNIYKRPLPAHQLRYTIPQPAKFIMGHTRMTTQGSERHNYNNHPFFGSARSGKFALCHNGVLSNDVQLRKSESLPMTKIQTDSYIAVQLIEQKGFLNFDSLKYMAEKVEGSFTFTILDDRNNLYIVRGDSPFALYHFQESGFYLYASTNVILDDAIYTLGIQDWPSEIIQSTEGDILKIDHHGRTKYRKFNPVDTRYDWSYRNNVWHERMVKPFQIGRDEDYTQELKSVAHAYGYSHYDIDDLIKDGFSYEEIEDMLHRIHAEKYDDWSWYNRFH